jgi:nucleoid-associated protein YgaU
MTERTAHDAGAIACPFVAFVDDRDERADVPDHRHRCYAEIRPAPRAIAHQQTYCLSPGFAACPTFQDWARREAARARGASATGRPITDEVQLPSVAAVAAVHEVAEGEIIDLPAAAAAEPTDGGDALDEEPFDDRASRNPHRDWADPPPWVDPAVQPPPPEAGAPAFLTRSSRPEGEEAVAPAGLSASRWLQDVPPPRTPDAPEAPVREPDDEVERALAQDRAERERAAALAVGVSATASSSRAARKATPAATPQKVSATRRGTPGRDVTGPWWERPRRNEAYPTLKTRIGLPSIPRVGLAALAIIVAAIVLFSLPFVLRLGGDQGGAVATATPSGGPSASTVPTEAPAATPTVYVVKPGDTLNKIAKKYKLTVDQLLAANKQIKNPNKIAVGDEITIPVIAAPSEVIDTSSAEPSPSAP